MTGDEMRNVVPIVFALTILAAPAHAQDKPEARNMALVGFHDLQARSAYQPIDPPARRPLDRLYRPSRRHQRCRSRSTR